MKHLDDWQIQRLVDDEVDPGSRARLEGHLQRCPQCQEALHSVQATSWAIRSTRPPAESLSYGREFWQCLTQRLSRTRACSLSWLSLLPPFLLGLLGTSVSLLVSATHTAHTLQSMGVLPPMGSTMIDRLARALASPMMEDGLYDRFGWSGDQVSQRLVALWSDMNQSTHYGAGFLMILFLLGILLSAFVMLHLFWMLCWMRTDVAALTGRARGVGSADEKGG